MYKLLIADDESMIRRGIKKLIPLEDLNIGKVFEAEDGYGALEMVSRERPDLVLLDINMPNMDGLSVAENIKRDFPEIYIIILTGYDYFEYMQKAIRARVDDYILKPVSKKDIEFILKTAVNNLSRSRKSKELEKIAHDEIQIDDKFRIIDEYLNSNVFKAELSLSSMSKDLGYSSNYLSVLIKDRYGMSFQDYINKKRMERAKILLLSTSKKNYEISEEIGIDDVNYFITKFKKTYRTTPKQFRQGKNEKF